MLPLLGAVGGFLDVAFNAQGIAVQRAYGRPILAGLHGIWSLGLFAGGGLGAAAAALGLSPTAHFAIVGVAVAAASAPLLAWQLPREAEPPHPHDTGRAPPLLAPQVLAARRDRVRGLRRRGRGRGLERDLRARPPRGGRRRGRDRRGRVRRGDGRVAGSSATA